MDDIKDMNRRVLLAGAAAMAGASALPAGVAAQENKRIVIGTWGGDYARLLAKHIETPLLQTKGFELVQDQASDAPRRAKLIAEKRLPRGTSDVQALSAVNVAEMVAQETLEKLDYSKIPNAANLLPVLKSDYSIPHIYSGLVILYNPKVIAKAPTSFADLFDPANKGKVGVIDIQYIYTMLAASLAAGGTVSNFDPGKPKLMELKANGVKVYPTNEALAQALKTEEVGMCIMWKARAVQWQNAGIPVQAVAPKEGVLLFVSEFAIPRNAQNKAGAYAYLNAALDPAPQSGFAVDFGYNATVSNATVAPDLDARIGFTADERKRLLNPDNAYITKNDAALKEWWDKSFKG
ncbi:MAG: ABC transporter substrate-binding protein [Beijerinckiaceae bacterium]